VNSGVLKLRGLMLGALLLAAGPILGQTPVILPPDGEVLRVQEYAVVRGDEGVESMADAQAADGYEPWSPDRPGKTWLRVPIQAPEFESGPWRIEIKRRFFRSLELYVPQADGSYLRYSNGLDEYQPVVISAQSMVYPLDLQPGQQAELLLHVDTMQGTLGALDLSILHERQYLANRAESMWAFGLYFGAVLALVFYNLVLYLNLRTPGHRMYVLAMTAVLLFMGMDSGLLQDLLPDAMREKDLSIMVVLSCLMMAATLRFFQVFTAAADHIPRTSRGLGMLAIGFLLIAVICVVAPLSATGVIAPASQLLSSLTVFALIGSSILAGLRGSNAAWVFLAAWGAFLVGGFVRSLMSVDAIPRTPLTEYSLYAGSMLEAMILALGLSYRVGQLREQRIRAENEQHRAMTLANQDALTGAYNRRFFENYLKAMIEETRGQDVEGALLLIDIDFFKQINDTHGHEAGDMMLRSLTRRCLRELRDGDVLCRLGGDEFAVVLRSLSGSAAVEVARRIHRSVSDRPVHYDGMQIDLSISVGVLQNLEPRMTRSEALRQADQALYRAKEQGRNRVSAETSG
jgi:diguanylate cyclase (GGDEF)-like protein